MKNVFNGKRILTLILSLFILLGLAFGFSSNNKVEANTEVNYLEDFYHLTYKDGKLELLFSADILDNNISKGDITTLKDRLTDLFKEIVKDSVKENYEYANVGKKSKTTSQFTKLGFRLTLSPYDEIDISTLTSIVFMQLNGNVENIDNFLNGTMYDTMINYYIDNYVTKFLTEHPAANANDALDEIRDQLYTQTQAAIDTTYQNLGVPAPDSLAKVNALVDTVRATKAADEKIEVTLSDVTDMMTIIEDSSVIVDVITELEVDADVQNVINNANAEDIVDFLTTVDVETIVDVVTNTDIMESADLENILTNMDAEDLVTIAESLDVDGIIEVAKAAGVTSDTLTTILEDKLTEIDMSDIFRFVKGIQLDGTTIYENGGFNFDGLLEIAKGLPKPKEIANFTDDQMNLQYQLALLTNFGNVNIDLKVGFYGDCSKVRKFASLIADYVDFGKDGSTYTFKFNAPEAFSELIAKLINEGSLSDALTQRLLNDSTLSVSEVYDLIQATSREEYIELLKQVTYEDILDYFLDADTVNAKLGTDLTNAQIDKIINKMLKLADGNSNLTLTNLVDIFSEFVDVSSIPTEKFDKALSKPFALLKALIDDDLTAEELRTYVEDETLSAKIISNLDNFDANGEKFDTLKSYLTKIYNKLPEEVKNLTLVDVYEGEGKFHYNGNGNLKELVSGLLPGNLETKTLFKKILDKLPTSATIDVTFNLPGLHKVEYHYGDNVKTLFLPSGVDVAFCSGEDKIDDYDIVLWVDGDDNEVELTIDDDIVVYAISDFELDSSDDVTATYDPNTDYDLTVTASPDNFDYTYQWYKGDTLLEGKTAATLKVKDVADSGTYKCKVSNGYFDKYSDEITVVINKKDLDLSGLTWNYTAPFDYDGTEKTVQITNAPEQIEVAYTGDFKKTEPGTYNATATYTLKAAYAENYKLLKTSDSLEWKINPAPKTQIDVSAFTWDYTDPFTYDNTEKKIQLTNVPEQVEVKYTDNAKTPAGTYTAKAEFTLKEAYANTHELSATSVTKEWTINKAPLTFENLTWDYTEPFTYDGTEKTVQLTSVPKEVTVAYTDNAKTEVGTYKAVANFTLKDEYAPNYDLKTPKVEQTWQIKAAPEKIQIDVSDVTWSQNEFEYDGTEKTVTLKNIPAHVQVTYSGVYSATEIGEYNASAVLSPESDEYLLVGETNLTLKWKIKAAVPQKQSEFKYGDKVIVTTADGLSTDYELNVTELLDFNRSIKAALDRYENGRTRVAYDIHFNKDGAKAQVNGEFTVKILLPEELKGVDIKLIHFTDDVDDSSAKAVEYKIEGDYIVFTTDGFSDFAVAEVKTAPHVPLVLWIILAVIFVIIIILLIFLLKKEKQNPEPVAAPFEQTYFIQLVNADDDTKARYEELKNHILEKKKDDESFKRVIDNIHEGFDDPEIITLIMVDGVLYAKVKDDTFEISSDSNLKKCVVACDAALDAPKVETPAEEPAEEEQASEEEQPAEEEQTSEEEQPAEEPAEEEQTSEEEQPAEESAEEEQTSEEEQPAEEPAEEEQASEEEQPAEEPAEEEQTSEEEQPAEEPAEEEQTSEEEQPAEEPAEEEQTSEEEQPAEESAEEEQTSEEEQHAEEPAEEEQASEEEQPAEEPAEEEQASEEEQPAEEPAEEDEGQEVSDEDLAADGVTDDEPTEEGEESEEELAAEDAKEKEKKQKTVYHVSKRDNNGREWKVFKQGSKKVIKLFETQKEALDYAKQLARNKDDGSYVLLHGLDGKLRKY